MELNLTAPINELGYGVAGLNILKGLIRNGCGVSYWPIGQPSVSNEQDATQVKSCMSNATMFKHDSPSLRIWHQHDMAQHIGSGRRVGFPIFELDKFSELEKHHLSSLQGIIVCSEWAKSIIQSEIPDMKYKIGVAPLGVDRSIFYPKDRGPRNKTIFLNIGKWEIRKGHDVLVSAFDEAFSEKDDVGLWMMNDNPFLTEEQQSEWHSMYLNCKLGDKIKIIPRVKSHEEVAEVMSKCDVGVFPSRAEGWNLEALEMMSMGKKVILTDYSAHTEFCNKENSRLIEIDEKEDAYDGIWFHGQGQWASIGESQVEQLVCHMRETHESKERVNHHGIETAKRFSWDNCCDKVMRFCGNMKGF